MKAKVLGVFFLIMISSLSLTAQEKQNHIARIEGEVNVGVAVGFPESYSWSNFTYGAEMRYNFQRLPLDAGIGYVRTFIPKNPGTLDNYNLISDYFYASCDYNFRQMKAVSFFAGTGIGYVSGYSSTPRFEVPGPDGTINSVRESSSNVCVMPRVGVEFWHRLRLTCSYQIQERVNQHFIFSITCVIGGGVRGK